MKEPERKYNSAHSSLYDGILKLSFWYQKHFKIDFEGISSKQYELKVINDLERYFKINKKRLSKHQNNDETK